jgi:hypothetical protein
MGGVQSVLLQTGSSFSCDIGLNGLRKVVFSFRLVELV